MGGGYWDDDAYSRAPRGGAAFAYSKDVASRPASERRANDLLDPKKIKEFRESRDSEEHPESNAIITALDVTGSMAGVVVTIRDALGNLMNLLLNSKFIRDPQMLFLAVGDATCDSVPMQITQFESDNRIVEQLSLVYLEKGGGGQNTESYELGFFAGANLTSIDCFEKRGRKGYYFSIGDEAPYGRVKKGEVKAVFGKTIQGDIPLGEVVGQLREKYHVFHFVPKGSSNYRERWLRDTWVQTLGGGELVIYLERPDTICETMALLIGLNEGTVTLEEGLGIISEKSGQDVADAVREAVKDFSNSLKSKPSRSDGEKKKQVSKPEKKKKEEKLGRL